MRFLVDECTGVDVVRALRDAGYDVLAVSESMPGADDAEILARAVAEERIVVTNDKDFGELVFRSGQEHHGVLLLRLQDESVANRVRVVTSVLAEHAVRLPGSFTVATDHNIRIRPLRPPEAEQA